MAAAALIAVAVLARMAFAPRASFSHGLGDAAGVLLTSNTGAAVLPRRSTQFDPLDPGVVPRETNPLPDQFYAGLDLLGPQPRQLLVTLPAPSTQATGQAGTVAVLLTWTTGPAAKRSVVRFAAATTGSGSRTATTATSPVMFTGTGEVGHRVELSGLLPSTQYVYSVGDDVLDSWSREYAFVSPPPAPVSTGAAATTDAPLRVLVYGDQDVRGVSPGVTKAVADDVAQARASGHDYALGIHVGDVGYSRLFGGTNLTLQSELLEHWWRQNEGILSSMPVVVTPGNHDTMPPAKHASWADECAVLYAQRIRMPGYQPEPEPATQTGDPRTECPYPDEAGPFWYSFDMGLVHFVSVSTEHEYGVGSVQHEWLQADLLEAAKPSARRTRPWIVVFLHRPLYCSHRFKGCDTHAPPVRSALEPLLLEAHVDLVIGGHLHSYERMHPLKYGEVVSTTTVNPNAPVHVAAGMSGAPHIGGGFPAVVSPLSAVRRELFGFVRLTVANATALRGEFVAVDPDRAQATGVEDDWWLVKTVLPD